MTNFNQLPLEIRTMLEGYCFNFKDNEVTPESLFINIQNELITNNTDFVMKKFKISKNLVEKIKNI